MGNLALFSATTTDELWYWTHNWLPWLNEDVLSGSVSLDSMVRDLTSVLRGLSDPTMLPLEECKQRLVILGMLGSSAERHSQQAGRPIGAALQALTAGSWSLSRYMATLASRVGGPARDSFLSYVVWNVPTVSVYLPDQTQPCYVMPGIFPDSYEPLTFSENPGEKTFLALLKRCAALEAAANQLLWLVVQQDHGVADGEALRSIESATLLLRAVREEMLAFMQRPEFTAPFFLDVLRQYACAWDAAETYSPPSGAHDHHFIVRDYLLGVSIDEYTTHIAALFHVLDRASQQELEAARSGNSLPQLIAHTLGLRTLDSIECGTAEHLQPLVDQNSWLGTYYRLYKANGELSATHWALISKYLLKPMHARVEDGPVISNREGSTHMGMGKIESFMHSRKSHPLQALAPFIPSQRPALSGEQLLTLARL